MSGPSSPYSGRSSPVLEDLASLSSTSGSSCPRSSPTRRRVVAEGNAASPPAASRKQARRRSREPSIDSLRGHQRSLSSSPSVREHFMEDLIQSSPRQDGNNSLVHSSSASIPEPSPRGRGRTEASPPYFSHEATIGEGVPVRPLSPRDLSPLSLASGEASPRRGGQRHSSQPDASADQAPSAGEAGVAADETKLRTAADLRKLGKRARLRAYRKMIRAHVEDVTRVMPSGQTEDATEADQADELRSALKEKLEVKKSGGRVPHVPYAAAVLTPALDRACADRKVDSRSPVRTSVSPTPRRRSPRKKDQQRKVEILSIPNPRNIYQGPDDKWPPRSKSPFKRSTNTTGRQRPSPHMTAKEIGLPAAEWQRRKARMDWARFLRKNEKEAQKRVQQQEIERKKLERESREVSRPTICPRSAKMTASRSKTRRKHGPVHERLFNMAWKSESTSSQLGPEFTFIPQINEEADRGTGGREGRRTKRRALTPPPPSTDYGQSVVEPSSLPFPFKPNLIKTSHRDARYAHRSFKLRLLSSVLRYYMRIGGSAGSHGSRNKGWEAPYEQVGEHPKSHGGPPDFVAPW